MIIEGKKTKLSMINAYRPCDNNSNTGISKTIIQKRNKHTTKNDKRLIGFHYLPSN